MHTKVPEALNVFFRATIIIDNAPSMQPMHLCGFSQTAHGVFYVATAGLRDD